MHILESQIDHEGLKINLYYDCPPIPTRNFDWLAIRADDDPEDNPICGYGATREVAIQALLDGVELENDQ